MPGKLHRAKIQEAHFFGKHEGCDLGKERQQKTDTDRRQIRFRPVEGSRKRFL